ncbi:hypothetical protein HKBW3S42_02458, partial [Candidatus Hakubella thermalkaliphila]
MDTSRISSATQQHNSSTAQKSKVKAYKEIVRGSLILLFRVIFSLNETLQAAKVHSALVQKRRSSPKATLR